VASDVQHCVQTLRLKVKREGYTWLNAAAIEVNQVWNFSNAAGYKAARPFSGQPRWLSAFDLEAGHFYRSIERKIANAAPWSSLSGEAIASHRCAATKRCLTQILKKDRQPISDHQNRRCE